jgi:hydroxymethylbilane synthase
LPLDAYERIMVVMNEIVIGSRGSALALTQTNWVAEQIRRYNPGVRIRVEIIKTSGDRILDTPLSRIGDKGLFVKELEVALLESRVDVAVHSMKDLPTDMPDGLCIAAVPEREEQCDVLVSAHSCLDHLPEGARVGSGSLRRRAQILSYRSDLQMLELRGNLDTRLKKLDSGEYDAIILACAGLHRLGLSGRVTEKLPFAICVPAVGQGALAIQSRSDDERVKAILAPLENAAARVEVTAERALMSALDGGCQTPIGGAASVNDGELHLCAIVASTDGSTIIRREGSGSIDMPEKVGQFVARDLMDAGAERILQIARGQAGLGQVGAA